MFASYQNEIYARGARGERPQFPVSIEALEAAARDRLSEEAFGYVAGGAGSESTIDRNLAAFQRWQIVPRMLRDVSERRMAIDLLGHQLPAPLLLAPIGVQNIVHPEGEMATARAARATGIPYIHSTAATKTPEDTAAVMGDAPRWFQLYWPRNPAFTQSFLERVERVGYSAVVVTLDTRLLAWRERDLNQAYLPFWQKDGLGIYWTDPCFRSALARPPEDDFEAAFALWAENFSDVSHTWEDLKALRRTTRLPLIVKGILHPEDARRAADCGVDGIIVSNHGGRQVDGSLAALEALPEIVEAVHGRFPVLFDSGIRRGADMFKALALGATSVLLGRPYMWGLTLGGTDGVIEVIRRLLADFDLTLALAGCADVRDLDRSWLHESGPQRIESDPAT